jgi:hypothetical protein
MVRFAPGVTPARFEVRKFGGLSREAKSQVGELLREQLHVGTDVQTRILLSELDRSGTAFSARVFLAGGTPAAVLIDNHNMLNALASRHTPETAAFKAIAGHTPAEELLRHFLTARLRLGKRELVGSEFEGPGIRFTRGFFERVAPDVLTQPGARFEVGDRLRVTIPPHADARVQPHLPLVE